MGDNKKSVTITVNGDVYRLGVGNAVGDIAPADTLAETLRERLLLTGTKISCDDGACGCCTVIMNGKAIPSCTVLTIECDGADIRTIEGLQDPNTGELYKVKQAFVDHSAFQCGYCTPGIIMTTEALLAENPHPARYSSFNFISGEAPFPTKTYLTFCRLPDSHLCYSYFRLNDIFLSIWFDQLKIPL